MIKYLLSYIGSFRVTTSRFFEFWITVVVLLFGIPESSGDNDLQQSFPFTVEVVPCSDEITIGENVDLHFRIKPHRDYKNTTYTIRYYQNDGEGTLKLVDGPMLCGHRVHLDSRTFHLNYTANSSEAHKFLVIVEDNFSSKPWRRTFRFHEKRLALPDNLP